MAQADKAPARHRRTTRRKKSWGDFMAPEEPRMKEVGRTKKTAHFFLHPSYFFLSLVAPQQQPQHRYREEDRGHQATRDPQRTHGAQSLERRVAREHERAEAGDRGQAGNDERLHDCG